MFRGGRTGDLRISIHTPARGVTQNSSRGCGCLCDFNPHSRKGSDFHPGCCCDRLCCISIHTPARGVTWFNQGCDGHHRDFNPHSRKGSDVISWNTQYRWTDFNPHSRKGSDNSVPFLGLMASISIHTPARGVTTFLSMVQTLLGISIHTPARGVTCTFFHPVMIR